MRESDDRWITRKVDVLGFGFVVIMENCLRRKKVGVHQVVARKQISTVVP